MEYVCSDYGVSTQCRVEKKIRDLRLITWVAWEMKAIIIHHILDFINTIINDFRCDRCKITIDLDNFCGWVVSSGVRSDTVVIVVPPTLANIEVALSSRLVKRNI